jgi:metal-responsive CopG/Arc/MetJ family transcriptional regulator
MKTAVSIPDEIFQKAEATAKQMRVSRSRLYASAIAEYLERHRSESVTERLNQVYSTQ